MGRHSVPDDDDSDDRGVDGVDGVDGADGAERAEPAADRPLPPPAPPAGKVRSGTAADLELLRRDRALRARAAAAAVVPLFAYVIVMLVIGRFDAFLIWIWIPVVAAGVLVGAFLDRAHAARARRTRAAAARAVGVSEER